MTPIYYWDGQVVKVDYHGISSFDKYLVDTEYEMPNRRYGMFMRHGGWRHIPIEDFPKEFRMHLLLMGVS